MSAKMVAVGGALVVGSLLGVFGLSREKRSHEADEAAARRADQASGARVEIARVTAAPPFRHVTLTGEVHPYEQATLFAKVSGYLHRVTFEKGQAVKAGEILGVIESPETEQDALTKVADVVNKKLVEKRYLALSKSGIVSQQEAEKAQADLSIANAELARAEALRGYEVIRAPFDGVVTARYADPGALLQAATSSQAALPLADVADLSRVRLQVFLGQEEALDVKEGDLATVWSDAHPDKKLDVKVTRFTRELEPKTRTMLTEFEVDNRAGVFYGGEFVHVALDVATPPALGVPVDALVMRGGKTLAIVVSSGVARFVPITLGATDGPTVRVLSGLHAGDSVVLHPSDDVVEGGHVQIAND